MSEQCWMCEQKNNAMQGKTYGVGPATFTAAWHRFHRAEHLAAFPNVDGRTKENLDMLVKWAEETLPY